jgi:hypothetical protein
MEYHALAKDILGHVGGKENIVSLKIKKNPRAACVLRPRSGFACVMQ